MRDELVRRVRGAFTWLPVFGGMNDLKSGSWFFFYGSVGATVTAMVPLLYDLSLGESNKLPVLMLETTWGLIALSGVFYALGSLALVRAFRDSAIDPVCTGLECFDSDELLAMWLYLLGSLPFIPYSIIFFLRAPSIAYALSVIGSVLLVLGCSIMVHASYESGIPKNSFAQCFLQNSTHTVTKWMAKHLVNDWLVGCWILLILNVIGAMGGLVLLLLALYVASASDLFVWGTFSINMLFYVIGSAYFVAGSYPHPGVFYMLKKRHRSRLTLADVDSSFDEEVHDMSTSYSSGSVTPLQSASPYGSI